MPMKISNTLVGTAGEYYVCAELCRRGYLALITPKNNPLFDIVATTPTGNRSVSIQVKTSSIQNLQGWKLGRGITVKKYNPSLFVVLVYLEKEGLPDFYVYEYDFLAEIVEGNYQAYMSQPKRDGSPRREVGFRWHDFNYFTDEDHACKNNWKPIENILIK